MVLDTRALALLAALCAVGAVQLPCATTGQTYKALRSPWIHAGPAGYSNDEGDVAGGGSLTSAGAVQKAIATSGGAWLAGSVNGGVWRTHDISAPHPHWDPVTDGQPVRCSSISALRAASFDVSLVFAGCGGSTSSEQGSDWNMLNDGDWGGVMYSRDGGISWAMTSFPPGYYVTDVIALRPAGAGAGGNPGDVRLLVSARSAFEDREDGGVWLGTLGGGEADWERTLHAPTFNLVEVEVAAASASTPTVFPTVFAALAMRADAVKASIDGGRTWTDFSQGLAFPAGRLPYYPTFALSTAAGAAAPPVLFVGALTVSKTNAVDTGSAIFYRELSAGAGLGGEGGEWRAVPNSTAAQWQLDDDSMPKDRMALLAHPAQPDTLFVAGNGDHIAWRVRWREGAWTKMFGRSGTADGSAPHCDCRNFAWRGGGAGAGVGAGAGAVAADGALVLVSDGGLFERSSPSAPDVTDKATGGSWRSLNGDIGAMEFLTAHWDYKEARWVGGAQDNDVQMSPRGADSLAQRDAPPAEGIVFGDGTVTAVDNSQAPARLFGTRQFLGQRDSDQVTVAEAGAEAGGGRGSGGDDDDDGGGAGDEPAGLLFRQGNRTVGVPLTKWFPKPAQFPYFVHPYTLNAARPEQLVLWVNGTGGGMSNATGWYGVELPAGLAAADDIAEPSLLAATPGAASVLTFVAGHAASKDEHLLAAANGTHLYYRAGSPTAPVAVKPLPTSFAFPYVLQYDADGQPIIGPVSHGQTVFLSVSSADPKMLAASGSPSVESNARSAGPDSVWVSADAGDSWTDASGDLYAATATLGRPRPSGVLLLPTPKGTALLVGTVNGVFVSWPRVLQGAAGAFSAGSSGNTNKWARLGTCADLPLVLVMGLSYEPHSDTLVAATMGRGVYVLHDALAMVERARNSLL
eukprot:g3279.t1